MDEDPKPNVDKPAEPFPYSTRLYSMTQMTSVFVTVNLILPRVLGITWSGTVLEQSVFFLVFAISLMLVTFLFLAVTGYFAILLMVAKNLRKLTMTDARNKDVAKALAIRVLLSEQPRWLISLTPCVVPASTLAILAQFYKDKLQFDSSMILLEACLIQGLVSFLMCLPFILKTQKMFKVNVLEDKQQS